MSGSVTQLLIIVLIIVLVFGTKKLSSLGSDLGSALKGFKKAMNDDDNVKEAAQQQTQKTPDADFASTSLPNEAMPDQHSPQQPYTASTQPSNNQDKEQV